MEYILHVCILVALYGVLALALDLLAGHTGLLSLAQAAFFGIGAYASAIATTHFRASFLEGVVLGMICAAVAAVLLAIISLRLREDYFAIATFGFQVVVASLFANWTALTRGTLGISSVPAPTIFSWKIDSEADFLLLSSLVLGITVVINSRLTKSPFGRVLHAIRDDEVFASSLGKNIPWFKLRVFSLGAILAALSGSLLAHYITYVDPGNFQVHESILIISMVILGGPGTLWGPLLGAALLVSIPEALRVLGFSGTAAGTLRQIFYASLLLTILVVRPRGLLGHYGFGR